MKTFLTNEQEIRAAIRRRGTKIYCVASNLTTYEIDQVQKQQGSLVVRPTRDIHWTNDYISIYSER